MIYQEIIKQVANQMGLPPKYVDKVYRAYWKEIYTYVTSLPLKEDLTEEQLVALRPNVNIPKLGKLNVTWENYLKHKKVYEKLISKNKN